MNVTRAMDKIGIIGAGLGGLAAACTLAARGKEVVVWDKNDWLGGKAAELSLEGWRFDMGPTILLMPSVLERIFAEAGASLSEKLDLIKLEPQWRSFFADGSTLDLTSDRAEMLANLKAFTGDEKVGEGYGRFLDLADRLRGISDRFYFWRSIGSVWDMFDPKATFRPEILADVIGMRPFSTVAETIRTFVAEERTAQMLDHFTQYVGSAPDQSPAVLCGIASMQTREGVWYPLGGTRAIPVALAKLAKELGVQFVNDALVKRIVLDDSDARVLGVETERGGFVALDAVVANSDTVRTHMELLPQSPRRRFAWRRKHEPACSGVVLYLGLDRRYEQLCHHNFVFSSDPEEEFDAIYRKGEPAPDPTCYVCAPAVTEPEVAPAGGEALYVLVHTPYLRPGHDWSELFPRYRRVILDKLERTAGLEGLGRAIRVERSLTPQDIHERYRVWAGAIYGLASHGRFAGGFKPANRSPDVAGLYFAGGSAHPGPGMPMALMSGWIAADALDRDSTGARDELGRVAELVHSSRDA